MIIGGLEKLTLIDFPGEVAAIVFTQGCNFRCQFCYNPMLVWPMDSKLNIPSRDGTQKDHYSINENDLFDFLRGRKGKLDGVVITGGEPTLHPDLPVFIEKIKALGFKVKLDTNGTNPEMLKKIFPLTPFNKGGEKNAPLSKGGEGGLKIVDYIAMDIKAPLEKYEKVIGIKANAEKIMQSIKMIMESGLPYEFRTTLVPGLHFKEDIAKMGEMIKGAEKWYLQFFKSDVELVNNEFKGKPRFTEKDMEEMAEIGKKFVKICEIRG